MTSLRLQTARLPESAWTSQIIGNLSCIGSRPTGASRLCRPSTVSTTSSAGWYVHHLLLISGIKIAHLDFVQDASIPVKPFPKGLRIFAGDPFNKAPIENNAAEFICQVRADFSRSFVSISLHSMSSQRLIPCSSRA
jgi:hypothetical protein